ncbi:sugar ABC transporter ATP-binding protein [Nocardia sp. NPDC059239]|uniref:sugar ABC transporter ATP-binding protein n=1 Tax=unclassified Nocardia TaxID=2637762 RepID=UPI0036A8DADC
MNVEAGYILELRSVSKTFGAAKVLTDVDLTVRAGEVHALMGQNGSGKSTLIKILSGFHAADPGASARINGVERNLGDPAEIHTAGVQFVHQDLGLVESLSVVDNLALGHGYAKVWRTAIDWRRQHDRARAAMELTGYHVDIRRTVAELKPVERTAVAIARALSIADSAMSLLVLDEPTATMPAPEVARLFEVVRRVRDRGVGVLYVSHHLDEVFELADRVTILADGRRVATRKTADLDRRTLVDLMTGGTVDEAPERAERQFGDQWLSVSGLAGASLSDLDLTVRAGEVVGVAGVSGSGRDELCSLLFGGRPRRGDVRVQGTTIPPLRPDQAVAAGMALVPSNRLRDGVVLGMNVRENVNLATLRRLARGGVVSRRRDHGQAAQRVRRFGIKTPSAEVKIEALSGGNQQKVVLGKWIETKPRVLLLDEPTQGVDIGAKADLHRLIDEAAEHGAAVVVCSSDETELERLCDRVIVLRDGRCSAEVTGADVRANRLARLSLGLS